MLYFLLIVIIFLSILFTVTGTLDDSDDSSGDNEDEDTPGSDENREEESDTDAQGEGGTSHLRTRAIRNQVLEAIFSASGARIVVHQGDDPDADADDQGNSCVTS